MEEPQSAEPTEAAQQEQIDVDGLVAELEAAGVNSTEQLQGKLNASKEAGQLANLLGQSNARVRELENALTAQQQQPMQPDYLGDEDEGVNLQNMMRNTIREEVARERQMTLQAQQFVNSKWQEILSDPDYPQVKDIWEQQCQDPNFQAGMQSGQIDPVREYNQTVRRYFRGIARKSVDAIKTLQKGGRPSLPHVEGSAQLPDQPRGDLSSKDSRIQQFRERVEKTGKLTSENDALAVLDTLLS